MCETWIVLYAKAIYETLDYSPNIFDRQFVIIRILYNYADNLPT